MSDKYSSPEETLTQIRHLMERSSRFISLSGLSGVMAGFYGLLGACAAHYLLRDGATGESTLHVVIVAAVVLVLAVGTGILLTTRRARKDGNSLFDAAARKLIVNLCIPLSAGGTFCLAVFYYGHLQYLAPCMLMFYGLALVHASKYTHDDIRSLGLAEVVLGAVALFLPNLGLILWALGFGVLHIVYGTYMYYKYEK